MVEIFSDPNDEGQVYEDTVPAGSDGIWLWNGFLTWGPSFVTATATDDEGNTSEFSTCYDEYEPNEDFAQAIPIEPGVEIESCSCHSSDEDYYRFTVADHSVINLTLASHRNYTLALYDASETLLGEAATGSGEVASLTYDASEGGRYYVQVSGEGVCHDVSDGYTLHLSTTSMATYIEAWVDEGWINDAQVYKLIPDANGPADHTLVEVVVDVTAEVEPEDEVYVSLTIPGDVFGPPLSVGHRYCLRCSPASTSWLDQGEGRYLAGVRLSDHLGSPPHVQVVYRFGIPPSVSPRVVLPSTEVRYTLNGEAAATAIGPAIHLVDLVD